MSTSEVPQLGSPTWLVQPLLPPRPLGADGEPQIDPYAEGPMLSIFPRDRRNALATIFTFAWLGASQYEGEALRQAVDHLGGPTDDRCRHIVVLSADEAGSVNDSTELPNGPAIVYVLSNRSTSAAVAARIRELAAGTCQTRDDIRLAEALRGAAGPEVPAGWLELDNGFFFFTDRTMFTWMAELLGIDVTAALAAADSVRGVTTPEPAELRIDYQSLSQILRSYRASLVGALEALSSAAAEGDPVPDRAARTRYELAAREFLVKTSELTDSTRGSAATAWMRRNEGVVDGSNVAAVAEAMQRHIEAIAGLAVSQITKSVAVRSRISYMLTEHLAQLADFRRFASGQVHRDIHRAGYHSRELSGPL